MRKHKKEWKERKKVVSLAMCTMVSFPMLFSPLGQHRSISADLRKSGPWYVSDSVDVYGGDIGSPDAQREDQFYPIDRYVWVDASGLKLRSQPSKQSNALMLLPRYARLHCTAVSNEWYYVDIDGGMDGYVLVSFTRNDPPPSKGFNYSTLPSKSGKDPFASSTDRSVEENKDSDEDTILNDQDLKHDAPSYLSDGEHVVAIAESLLGTPYLFGGDTCYGIDCSGLVAYCYAQLGIELPHHSDTIRYEGMPVLEEEIKPGDVVVYDCSSPYGEADHVAIYAGDGKVIHSSSKKGGVVWGDMENVGMIVTIRRFVL